MRLRGIIPLLALLALPAAAAQLPVHGPGVLPAALAVTVDAPAAPLPADAPVSFPYRVEYVVEGPTLAEARVVLHADAPPGWTLTLEPSEHELPARPGTRATYTLEGLVTARHDGTPRAFAPQTLRLHASTDGDGLASGPASAEAPFALTPDWRPGLYAVIQAPRLALDARGGEDVLNADITNTGNAPVIVRAERLRAPGGCAAGVASAPRQLAPGERGLLSLDVDCGRGWSAGSVTLRLEHALVDDEARAGAPVEPQWDLVPAQEGTGFAFGASGPARTYGDPPVSGRNDASWGATLLVPAALALGAMLVRRR